jgi:hypothetical protein
VHFSSSYFLDGYDKEFDINQTYTETSNQLGEWVQISSDIPQYWTGIIVQGEG